MKSFGWDTTDAFTQHDAQDHRSLQSTLNPFPLIFNTTQPLIIHVPYKRACALETILIYQGPWANAGLSYVSRAAGAEQDLV